MNVNYKYKKDSVSVFNRIVFDFLVPIITVNLKGECDDTPDY